MINLAEEKICIVNSEINSFLDREPVLSTLTVTFKNCTLNSFKYFNSCFVNAESLVVEEGGINLKEFLLNYQEGCFSKIKQITLNETLLNYDKDIIDLSGLKNIEELSIIGIKSSIRKIIIPKNIKHLCLERTDCSFIDFTELNSLKTLTLKDNELSVIRLESNKEISSISIREPFLKYIELLNLESLTNLFLENLLAEEIFLKNLKSLVRIFIDNNKKLKKIYLEATPELRIIYSSSKIKLIEHENTSLKIHSPSKTCTFLNNIKNALEGKVTIYFTTNILKQVDLLLYKILSFFNYNRDC